MYVAEEEEQGAEEVVARSFFIFFVSIFSFFCLARSEVQSAILSIVETGADAVSEGAQGTNNGS